MGTVLQKDGQTDGPHKALFVTGYITREKGIIILLLNSNIKFREKGTESNHIPPILDILFFFENVVNFGYFNICKKPT